jgi:hypothetical protein
MHNYNSGAPTVVALVNLREKANCGQAPDDYPHRDALACEVVPNAVHTVSVDIVFCMRLATNLYGLRFDTIRRNRNPT